MTEAIRKQAEQWIDGQAVSAMLAGMKYRVAELTGEHRYCDLGFIPHDCRHYDRESFLAGRRLAEGLPIDPKARRPAQTPGAPPPQAPPSVTTWRDMLESFAGYLALLLIIGVWVHKWLSH
jgi:hypothetical protein